MTHPHSLTETFSQPRRDSSPRHPCDHELLLGAWQAMSQRLSGWQPTVLAPQAANLLPPYTGPTARSSSRGQEVGWPVFIRLLLRTRPLDMSRKARTGWGCWGLPKRSKEFTWEGSWCIGHGVQLSRGLAIRGRQQKKHRVAGWSWPPLLLNNHRAS